MATDPDDPTLTRDGFLGGRLTIRQPAKGYRAGIDAVLLAAAVPALAGQSVLDLGCGVAVAGLCLGARVPGLSISGIEIQEDYAELARVNARENALAMDIVTGDLARMPESLRQVSFDHAIANPPYFHAPSHSAARDPGRAAAQVERTPLSVWIDAATRRLKPGGRITVIQRADRLRDLLAACDGRLGSLVVWPIQPRVHQPAQLVILAARKGGRAALRLRNPLILHEGERHETDAESYTAAVSAVLRDAMPLI